MASPATPIEERVSMTPLAPGTVRPQYLQAWVILVVIALCHKKTRKFTFLMIKYDYSRSFLTSKNCESGMAVGRDLKGMNNSVVAVIGDGAMTAGQAYEALNNAGYLDCDMIVILNDNKQVSLPTANLDGPTPPVGALSCALSRLQSNRPLRELREVAKASY